MAFFSVIVPNYNSGELLEKAIRSCQQQTYSDWEMIVVDNNSDDCSGALVGKLNDFRIRQIQIDNHGIIAASRNLGASFATGTYLAFLDADDTWNPDKLNLVKSAIDRENSEFIYHKLKRVPKRRYLRPNTGSNYRKSQIDILMAGNRIPNSSVVMSRRLFSKLGGFDESPELVASEDFDLWIRVADTKTPMFFLHRVLGTYFESADGMNSSERRILSAVAVLNKHNKSQIPGWLLLCQMLRRTRVSVEVHHLSSAADHKIESLRSFVHLSDYLYYKSRKMANFLTSGHERGQRAR